MLTVGHSTRAIDDFIRLVQANGVSCVADVRTIPRSRHNPQFNQDCLPRSLSQAGIGYVHLAQLGGLRHTTRQSPNLGWRNESFRGFADYMQTREFEKGLTALMRLAGGRRVAIMCAEAVPWACHRSLIADALLVRGVRVQHILSLSNCEPHALTSFARVRGARLTYPAAKAGATAVGRRRKAAQRASASRPRRALAGPVGRPRSPARRRFSDQGVRRVAG